MTYKDKHKLIAEVDRELIAIEKKKLVYENNVTRLKVKAEHIEDELLITKNNLEKLEKNYPDFEERIARFVKEKERLMAIETKSTQ